eukprot:gene8350-11296_t
MSLSAKKLRDTLTVFQDIIKSQQLQGQEHEPTPTEYFALITSLLISEPNNENLSELLQILIVVIPKASSNVVRSQFNHIAQVLMTLAQINHENTDLLLFILQTMGKLIVEQECTDSFWNGMIALKSINVLLAFIDDDRSTIRSITHSELKSLMKKHTTYHCSFIRNYLTDFCIEVFKSCCRSDYKRSLYLVLFLEGLAIGYISSTHINKLMENILKLQQSEIPKLTAAICRLIDSLFQYPVNPFPFPFDATVNSYKLLLRSRPSTNDMEANTFYCTALSSGFICIHKLNRLTSYLSVNDVMNSLMILSESDFTQVHCGVGTSLKRIISTCVDKSFLSSFQHHAGSLDNIPETKFLKQTISYLERLLQLRYQNTWIYILDVIRSLLDVSQYQYSCNNINKNASNAHFCKLMTPLIAKLGEIYQAYESGVIPINDVSIHISVGETLGNGLKSFGFAQFYSVIPLTDTNDVKALSMNNIESNTEWAFNVYHKNLKYLPCELADFGKILLPIAGQYSRILKSHSQDTLNATQTKLLKRKVLQIWSLLPEFCHYGPCDLVSSFPIIVPVLLKALNDPVFPELTSYVISALNSIAKYVKLKHHFNNDEVYATVSSFSTQFVPILLKFVEEIDIGDSHFQIGLQCISSWIAISQSQLVTTVAKKLLQLLLTSNNNQDNDASGWMAVMLSIIPFLPETLLHLLYRTVRPLLSVDESVALQKRAYSLLNSLLTTHSQQVSFIESRLNLLGIISESLLTCNVSSRNMRLKSIESILSQMNDVELKEATNLILGEVIICQKDSNKKTRDGANNILKIIFSRSNNMELILKLCSGLIGETASMRSAALNGICILLLEQRDDEELISYAAHLLPSIVLLLKEEISEQTKAVLSYFRICSAIFPDELLESMSETMIISFCTGLGQFKEKFSSRCRAILRKLNHRLGEEKLRKYIPTNDLPLLEYINRQARRAKNKKANRSKSQAEHLLGSDSDDSGDDDEEENDLNSGYYSDENHSKFEGEVMKSVMGSQISMRDFGRSKKDDYRLLSRPKATKAKEMQYTSSTLPTTLDDLLEDQPPMQVVSGQTVYKNHKTVNNTGLTINNLSIGNQAKISNSTAVDGEDGDQYCIVFSSDGKLIVKEREIDNMSLVTSHKDKSVHQTGKSVKDDGMKSVAGSRANTTVSQRNSKKRKPLREPGEEYRSKKAGGDVWKKGMLEPHAYIPLDPRLLSKKNHREAVNHFAVVVNNKKHANRNNGQKKSRTGMRK